MALAVSDTTVDETVGFTHDASKIYALLPTKRIMVIVIARRVTNQSCAVRPQWVNRGV